MNDGERKEYYPDSPVRITDSFFVMACSCGMRRWSLLGEDMTCPKCGQRMIRKEAGDDT